MRTNLLCLFFFAITSPVLMAQYTSEYYRTMCSYKDSLVEVSFLCHNERVKMITEPCIGTFDSWGWFYDLEDRDAVLETFRKMIIPVMGEYAADRIVINSITNFNPANRPVTDSIQAAYFAERGPHCPTLTTEYECFLKFDDSIWMPLTVLADKDGKILNAADLPRMLTTPESFKLMPVCDILQRVMADEYMLGEEVSFYADLHYSPAEKLFYFEFSTYSNNVLEETSTSWLTEHKHIFIDAKTGKILWRTTAKHFEEHAGSRRSVSIELPSNALIGN